VSLLVKAPELDKLLETQLRPKYCAHCDTADDCELNRRPTKPEMTTVGTFTK
jgi:hypothetical protein